MPAPAAKVANLASFWTKRLQPPAHWTSHPDMHVWMRSDSSLTLTPHAPQTAYANRLPIPNAPSVYSTPDPKGYEAVHLYFLSRHGSRYPTAGRMQQINSLPSLFKVGLAWLHCLHAKLCTCECAAHVCGDVGKSQRRQVLAVDRVTRAEALLEWKSLGVWHALK